MFSYESHVACLLTLVWFCWALYTYLTLLRCRKSNLLKYEADNIRLLVIRDTEQGIKKLFDSQIRYDGTVSHSLTTVYMFFMFLFFYCFVHRDVMFQK